MEPYHDSFLAQYLIQRALRVSIAGSYYSVSTPHVILSYNYLMEKTVSVFVSDRPLSPSLAPLQSKRIGHFFFWYVRSEVAGCPYFRQRMAVILEAYLLGCGQAMINSFVQQVQAVEALQEVAILIKQIYPDKTDLPPTGVTFHGLQLDLWGVR